MITSVLAHESSLALLPLPPSHTQSFNMAVDPFTWLANGIGTHIALKDVKNILTAVFSVLNLLIAFLGGRLITRQAHRRILNHRAVPVTEMLPWLSLTSSLEYMWSTRKPPGGWLGSVMVVSGIFSVMSHYFVNSFVDASTESTMCTFESGLLTTSSSDALIPDPVWPAATIALAAQNIVVANGLNSAIFSKIENRYLNFYPGQDDILGFWNCTFNGYSEVGPADAGSHAGMNAWLDKQTALYHNYSRYDGSSTTSGIFNAVVAVGTDQPSTSKEIWNVSAIVSNDLSTKTTVNATNFLCSLNITNPFWTPAPMDPGLSFTSWLPSILGMILEIDSSLFQQNLEIALNTMSILSGSGNHHFHNTTNANATGAGTTFGCWQNVNYIQWPIFLVLLVFSVILVAMLLANIYDLFMISSSKNREITEQFPIQLLDWQLAMARRSTGDESLKEREIGELEYIWDPSTSSFLCRRIVPTSKVCFPMIP